jgi:hypothetical protein
MLFEFAERINSLYLPNLMEHDPERQVGILLCGKVDRIEGGEHALYAVIGLFQDEEEKSIYAIGSPNVVWDQYLSLLDSVEEESRESRAGRNSLPPSSSPVIGDLGDIARLLERYLDSTAVWTDGRVYSIKHLIDSTNDLQLQVYPKDHDPAHFHIRSKGRSINARFDLQTLELLPGDEGKIGSKDVKKIRSFLDANPQIYEKLKSEHGRLQG